MKSRSARYAIYRKRAGGVLIGVQIAITLAILSNALALIVDRLAWSARPTGIDEANIFFIYATTVDKSANPAAIQASDLALLRSLPGVANAYSTNSFPLEGGGFFMDVSLTQEQKTPSAHISYYFGDEHTLDTLGVKLLAGRNFTAPDVVDRSDSLVPTAVGIIITRALAQQLFPGGDALGKSIYVDTKDPVAIIGIMDRLLGPSVAATGFSSTFTENSALAPFRPIGESVKYAVRSVPGRLTEAMTASQNQMGTINGTRIINTTSMIEARAKAYRSNRGLTLLLASVALILVAVTAFGMVGLTSYWVAQRRRQIGIRRALGATRAAILRLFQTENFLIALSGSLAGMVLAVALNLWLVSTFEMIRIGPAYLIGSGIAMLLLGQIAVLWPAMRAARIPPALAIRGSL